MGNKYKDTLLLGQTDFEMRGNLKNKEPGLENFWEEQKIYQKKLQQNADKPLFMLHDGPPYANGDLHIGHALNKTLKDFIIRWKNSSGYQAPYIMGWDTHGLPIETAVTKTGVNRKTMSPDSFRDLSKQYALKQVANQAQQFARLGIFTDYETRYLTLDHDYEMAELKLFAKMFNDGLIYKALKPIYWSPSSESALAESEIEYQDVVSPSVYVGVDILANDLLPANTKAIIWTTTPWTLPANQLIAVGENLAYVLMTPKGSKTHYLLAKNLLPTVAKVIGWEDYEINQEFSGKDLVNLPYNLPFFANKQSKLVLGHHVTDEAGTGLVHIASGFGEDDYIVAKNNNIPIFAPLDDQGRFTSAINDEELIGQFYEKTNEIVIERLKNNQSLLKVKPINHSYPHDWRTKKPVIYRATLQWFINLSQGKEAILTHVNNVETRPRWAKQRLYQVLDDRIDWTISRQRLWGVPIIGFYDQQGKLVLNQEILQHALKVFEKYGTNAWFKEEANFFLPSNYQNKGLKKEKDILDVWFDSGSSALALEARFPQWQRPYDLYLEGNDQYRGWFNASMINSVIFDDKTPYLNLISHGMTTDEKGRKMSKSLGNGIDPLKVANDLGADILRLWVASTDYTNDQKIGPEILKQIAESYRKIRNTLRFIVANLADFNPDKNYQKSLAPVDEYALHQLTIFKNQASEAYNNYQFNNVYNLVINYITKDLSAFYLDFIKDILYVEALDSKRRFQVQTVLYEQLWGLIDILKPLIPHTIEELYQHWQLPKELKVESVHLLDNRLQNFTLSPEKLTIWNQIIDFKSEVNKALEVAKTNGVVSKSLEAVVYYELKPEFANLAKKWPKDLAQVLIISELKPLTHEVDESLQEGKMSRLKVVLNEGQKCERCWTIHRQLNVDKICQRCEEVVQKHHQK
ncbi:isoleucyl-tRNA synthetase [Entomoplasma freundtii]|uniref:Isoleucine--tRNA ligase n=1 Tax=Entomoplasma freundtii TaxID=74700 RepID=A0A2K8NTK3_9MOLU|nr:isoleucine--tRNA ligase [Entomoplasma freundtii]ATZ16508.1 isoleucyl-tRNA synthetase [Entomoplasma freundtii]TDY56038.1 isoleucyl-tRNA synthetase [Entomoplasma freundtii]